MVKLTLDCRNQPHQSICWRESPCQAWRLGWWCWEGGSSSCRTNQRPNERGRQLDSGRRRPERSERRSEGEGTTIFIKLKEHCIHSFLELSRQAHQTGSNSFFRNIIKLMQRKVTKVVEGLNHETCTNDHDTNAIEKVTDRVLPETSDKLVALDAEQAAAQWTAVTEAQTEGWTSKLADSRPHKTPLNLIILILWLMKQLHAFRTETVRPFDRLRDPFLTSVFWEFAVDHELDDVWLGGINVELNHVSGCHLARGRMSSVTAITFPTRNLPPHPQTEQDLLKLSPGSCSFMESWCAPITTQFGWQCKTHLALFLFRSITHRQIGKLFYAAVEFRQGTLDPGTFWFFEWRRRKEANIVPIGMTQKWGVESFLNKYSLATSHVTFGMEPRRQYWKWALLCHSPNLYGGRCGNELCCMKLPKRNLNFRRFSSDIRNQLISFDFPLQVILMYGYNQCCQSWH